MTDQKDKKQVENKSDKRIPINRNKRWTADDEKILVDGLADDKTHDDMADRLGRSTNSISLRCHLLASSNINKGHDKTKTLKEFRLTPQSYERYLLSLISKAERIEKRKAKRIEKRKAEYIEDSEHRGSKYSNIEAGLTKVENVVADLADKVMRLLKHFGCEK